jgi:hypothetical protein
VRLLSKNGSFALLEFRTPVLAFDGIAMEEHEAMDMYNRATNGGPKGLQLRRPWDYRILYQLRLRNIISLGAPFGPFKVTRRVII